MKKRKRNLKGTVLFTTVSVMALLILFLLGTLTLASASNNRAHKTYSSSQANYTAKAAIDGFIKAMQSEKAVEEAVIEVGKSGGASVLFPTVEFDDTSFGQIVRYDASTNTWMPNSIIVEADSSSSQFEYMNDANAPVNEKKDSAKWVAVDRVKITATARVGKEYETVVAYLNKLEGEPADDDSGSPMVKGVQMLEGASFPAGRRVTGGLGVNLKHEGNPEEILNNLRNSIDLETTLSFINSSVCSATSTFRVNVFNPKPEQTVTPYSQTIITGDLVVANDSFVTVAYDLPGTGDNKSTEANKVKELSAWTNKDVPYLYVDKCLYFESQSKIANADNSPFNLFVGTLNVKNGSNLTNTGSNPFSAQGTNIYMMDEYTGDTNVYSFDDKEGNAVTQVVGKNRINLGSTKLEKWADSIATGSSVPASTIGGSIFCNGDLVIDAANASSGGIAGDLRVKGNLTILGNNAGDLKVGGSVLVGGTITYMQNGNPITTQLISCSDIKQNLNAGGGATPSIVSDRNWPNTEIVGSGSISEANFTDETNPSEMYQIPYVEWKPSEHDNKDIFGNDCTDDPSMVRFYKYRDDLVLHRTVDPNLSICVADPSSYEDLRNNTDFIALLDKLDPSVVYVDSMTRDDRRPENPYDRANTYYYGVPCLFTNDDGSTVREVTCQPADGSKYYYYDLSTEIPKKYVSESEKADIIANAPVTGEKQYYRKDYEGNETADIVPYDTTYYAGAAFYGGSEAEAVQKAQEASGGGSGVSNIYPSDMTREAIYVQKNGQPAPKETKIITTITEARDALGLQSDGEVNPTVYKHVYTSNETDAIKNSASYSEFKASKYSATPAGEKIDVSSYMNTVIEGSAGVASSTAVENVDGKYTIKSNCMLTGTFDGSTLDEIHIDPQKKELNIVLFNVYLDHGAKLVVEPGGHVNFYLIGTLKTGSGQEGVFTSEYLTDGFPFDYTKDWGINWYGAEGSSIDLVNDATLIGAFKMPYTAFSSKVRGAKVSIKYTDEYGNTFTPSGDDSDPCPVIVGNALFKNYGGDNALSNYYTATGAEKVTPDSTEVKKSSTGNYWNIKYRAAS